MMARDTNVPFKGRIQKRKTCHLQIITFGLQRAAGPYSFQICLVSIYSVQEHFVSPNAIATPRAASGTRQSTGL